MKKHHIFSLTVLGAALIGLIVTGWWVAAQTLDDSVFLPMVMKAEPPPEPMVEFRGLWVTRFDWTTWDGAHPAKIDEIVQNTADAGFNVLFFQVRGEADAYYASDLEPWAKRITGYSGALGQPPGPEWAGLGDPLSYLIEKAHEAGLQVHAYVNVYPVAACTAIPSANVTPMPLYHQLIAAHGVTLYGDEILPNGLQWTWDSLIYCGSDNYMWATPASEFHEDHVLAVLKDVAARYDIDGLHLDRVRYAQSYVSCDPVSLAETGACFGAAPAGYASYEAWQRAQVNEFVARVYYELLADYPDLWLSAAVWPVHTVKPEWGWQENYVTGYDTYYQDSKEWLAQGSIDSISPMIYPSNPDVCPDDNPYWSQERWATLTADFQEERNGRYIIPGIGGHYCSFDEIAARIQMAREIGVAGHAIFSYRLLLEKGYFDELAAGPYAETAVVPNLPWRPRSSPGRQTE